MADSEIVDYVKAQLKAGYTIDQIRKALLDANYEPEEAQEAIEEAQAEPAMEEALPIAGRREKTVSGPARIEGGGRAGFALSIIGSILILLSAIMLVANYTIISDIFSQIPALGTLSLGLELNDIIVVNIVLAIGIILCAVLSHKRHEIRKTTGMVIIALSILSLLNGGGFFLAIIALIGGLLVLAGK